MWLRPSRRNVNSGSDLGGTFCLKMPNPIAYWIIVVWVNLDRKDVYEPKVSFIGMPHRGPHMSS